MTQKWTNENIPGALYFVTANTHRRLPIFAEPACCRAFLAELQQMRAHEFIKLIAFVLMPDHFHAIVNPHDDDIQSTMRRIKSLTAKAVSKVAETTQFRTEGENQVWQESFHSLPLWSGWMVKQKIDYIHANPVIAGFAHAGREYHWSSFRSFYLDDPDPLITIDTDWWWEGDIKKLDVSVAGIEESKRKGLIKMVEANRERKAGK